MRRHVVAVDLANKAQIREAAVDSVTMDRRFVLAFRLLMGWTFLYAGTWQVLSPDFSAATFLAHTKTFHDIYAPLTSPALAPVLTFLVKWGTC